LPKVDQCVSGTYLTGSTGDKLWSAGYGRVEYGGNYSPRLKKVDISSIMKSECESVYPFAANLPGLTCAGGNVPNWNTCQGDSGGALLYQSDKNHYYQYGVVSFGPGGACGSLGFPSGFTRTTSYLYWIQAYTGVATEDGPMEPSTQLQYMSEPDVCREELKAYNFLNTGFTKPIDLLESVIAETVSNNVKTPAELAYSATQVGCWCPKFAPEDAYLPVWHGGSMDEYDHLCKEFSKCVRQKFICQSGSCYGGNMEANLEFYWKVDRSGEYICRIQGYDDACGHAVCQCYLDWATGISKLIDDSVEKDVVSSFPPNSVDSEICNAAGDHNNVTGDSESIVSETSVDDFGNLIGWDGDSIC